MNNSIKARLAALQALAAQKRSSIGFMQLRETGEWFACRGGGRSNVFPTEGDAKKFLTGCTPVIIIDV